MKQRQKDRGMLQKALLFLGVVALLVAGWFLIKQNIFGVGRADRVIYGLGLLVAIFLWVLGVCEGESILRETLVFQFFEASDVSKKKHLAGEILRVCAFTLIALLGMYYFNSGSNHGHRVVTRLTLLCLAVVAATYFHRRELWNRYSLAVSVLCIPFFVEFANLGFVQEGKELEFKLDFVVAVCFGPLLVALGRRLFTGWKDKNSREAFLRDYCVSYLAQLLGFFVLLVLFRNTRGWTFTVAVPFTLFYLLGLNREKWRELLQEFRWGVLWSFGAILAFSLLFRPYQKLFNPRYPLAFYSVATCSLYLVVVFLAAFCQVLSCFWEKRQKHQFFVPLLVMGTVFCYTGMTISRTAFLAIGSAAALAFFCLGTTLFRKQLLRLGMAYVTPVLAALFLFPLVFTLTRGVPALVGHPYVMGGEFWEGETITSEDPMDSEKYMDWQRFRSLTLDKLFGAENKNVQAKVDRIQASIMPALLVAHGVTPETWYNESENSVSNGRVDIFKAYLARLNLTGHDAMGVDTEEMSYPHAHNTFLQTAYDHGIFVGICFLLLGVVSGVRALVLCLRQQDKIDDVFPLMVLVAFGMAGMTEWVFHPSILLGFTLLLVQGILVFRLPGGKG